MAQIITDKITIEVHKLFKDAGPIGDILDESQLAVLAEVVETTVAEILNDPTLVVEVKKHDASNPF